jgi:outer membrane protein TolC
MNLKNICKTVAIVGATICMGTSCYAQQMLTLEECRSMAMQNSNTLKMAGEKEAGAEDLRKMALRQFFPKLSANGAFTWNEKSISLLSDEQKDKINNMGTSAQDMVADAVIDYVHDATGVSNATLEQDFRDRLHEGRMGSELNDVGHEITSAMEFDLRQIYAGSVTLSQPIYLGGKLIAAYKAAKLTRELAGIEMDSEKEKLQQQVDEAYWRVVSVKHKQQLAQEYYNLLSQLSDDVTAMAEVEVATQGDVAKVRVKLNEAKMNLTKATTGLTLSKMVLCQLCGLPLDRDIDVVDIDVDSGQTTDGGQQMWSGDSIDMQAVLSRRRELRMLRIGDSLAREGVRVAASQLQPNIVVTGSYGVSNPNMFNGYQKTWDGMFSVGVAANIPLVDAGACYAVKAAKHKRREIGYQIAEAEERITLQVNKLNFELQVAERKLAEAESNGAYAEETLRMANESFKAGVIGSSDLMAAQTSWLSARSEIIDAEIEIKMDRLYLKQALGM